MSVIFFLYIGVISLRSVGNIASYLSIVVWGATLTLVSKCASILPLQIVGLAGVMPGVAQVERIASPRLASVQTLCRCAL